MKGTQLQVDDSAPQFVASDALGKPVDLAKYKDSFVLLVFLRYSGCPLCNLTLHRLTLEYPMLAKNGCQVIAFVQSGAENIKKNIYGRHKLQPPFPIIPDPDRKIYKQYAVGRSAAAAIRSIVDIPFWLQSAVGKGYKQTTVDGDLLQVPATFLVGPDEQRIVKAEYSSSFYDHRAFTDIYEPLIFK